MDTLRPAAVRGAFGPIWTSSSAAWLLAARAPPTPYHYPVIQATCRGSDVAEDQVWPKIRGGRGFGAAGTELAGG